MTHLSSDQISAILIGSADESETRHARDCRACASEIAHVESALGLFRSSVDQAAERRMLTTRASVSYRPREAAAGLSLLFHGVAIAGMLVIGAMQPATTKITQPFVNIVAPVLKPYLREPEKSNGGGGGGSRAKLPASEGTPPKAAARQFVPPHPPESAKLVMTPTILADAPDFKVSNLGDPLSHIGVPSNGAGCCAGIGNGRGTGVGVGDGAGAGDGRNGGFFGYAFSIGGGVSAPIAIVKVEPEYSDEARKARFQGTVRIEMVVDEHGNPGRMRVVRALGLGLDEKAMESVAKWKFKPGMKNGKPVPVVAVIDVTFRLL